MLSSPYPSTLLPFYSKRCYRSVETVRPINVCSTFARLFKNAQKTATFTPFYGRSMISKPARFCDGYCTKSQRPLDSEKTKWLALLIGYCCFFHNSLAQF